MLNAPSKYAIRALLCLANKPRDLFIRVPDLAKESKVPSAYLSKLVKTLVEHEILQTRKGAHGGVILTTKEVSFYEICEIFADPIISETCLLSHHACDSKNPCPFHKTYDAERKRILRFLKHAKVRTNNKR